jgi:uncharacterized damage-inducible protein DinB
VDTRFRTQHLSLAEITANVPQEALQRAIAPGKWTAFENAAHLAVFHPVFMERFRRILAEDGPVMDKYEWEKDPLFARYKTIHPAALLDLYRKDREEMIAFVDGLDAAALRRKGTHQVYGTFDMAQWIELFVLHESHHLFTIFRLVHYKTS